MQSFLMPGKDHHACQVFLGKVAITDCIIGILLELFLTLSLESMQSSTVIDGFGCVRLNLLAFSVSYASVVLVPLWSFGLPHF